MAMSSYLINSNYVDPKFPPCEEYSQNDYLPNHSPDYYSSQRQETAVFQPDSLYHHHQHHPQHQQRAEPPYTQCQRAGQPASVVMSPRGHVLPPSGLQTTPVPEQSHRCESVTPSPPPPPSCGQTPHSQGTSSPASTRKDPVVYPWMKKVHVNIGKCHKQTSSSLSPLSLVRCAFVLRAALRHALFKVSTVKIYGLTSLFSLTSRRVACGSRFTIVCLQGQYNYTLHKFLLHLFAEVPFEVLSRAHLLLIPRLMTTPTEPIS